MRGEGVEVSLNFFPVSRKSDFFFMRLPVGSVVFVSHRRKRVVFRVCKVLGIEPMDEDSMKAQGFRPDEIARRQLETITEALNEGWKPNWADTDEYKFYPWFYIEVSEVQTEGTTGADAGLSCANAINAAASAYAHIGSRLCFHNRETARYAGRTFTDLYAQILIEKI